MKNSKEYTIKITDYAKSIKKDSKNVELLEFETDIHTLLFAIISEFFNHSKSEKALKNIQDHFVDWNDLRVSRNEEIIEVLGGSDADSKKVALNITSILQRLFDEYDSVCFNRIIDLGKRQARQSFEDMKIFSLYSLNFLMMKVMKAHSLPLTEKMIAFLIENDLVHEESDEKDIASFVERNISASDLEGFYMVLREQSEGKKKAVAKKAAAKKSVKKATKKKAAK